MTPGTNRDIWRERCGVMAGIIARLHREIAERDARIEELEYLRAFFGEIEDLAALNARWAKHIKSWRRPCR